MKVLIVDDSSTMRRIIKNAFQKLGHTDLVEAEDGLDALKKLSECKIDFLVTDWNMPNLNGLELVIKTRKTYPDLPIMMITTEGGRQEVITALKAGVNNYIIKPFTSDVLKEKLKTVLGED